MAIKWYSKKEPIIIIWILVPYITVLNVLAFGTCIFSTFSLFFKSFLFSGVYLCLSYLVFGMVAFIIQKRFPAAGDMFKRIAIMLPVFYVMNLITMLGLFDLYNGFSLLTCAIKQSMLLPTVIYGCLMSTVITFINEGVANWEAWKASVTETEKLKNVYQRSKVLGLKGQINPHFLFNCFNSLSALIQEDEEKAERFLDEMTKVHRYLLISDDELLVSLNLEIKFAESYLFLAKERFGDAFHYVICIDKNALQRKLPPLSMQVILENIIYTNALTKDNPLTISITIDNEINLSIANSVHEKKVVQNYNVDDGLDNLLNKYKILNAGNVYIKEQDHTRVLLLPLFDSTYNKEEAL